MGGSSPHRIAVFVVGALVFVAGYLVFPVESDAGYVINDALWNASGPELRPWTEISAHHPLFHVAANLLTPVLDACGVEQPGHHAAKMLSAMSGALGSALSVLAGGARRWWAGLLVAAPLVATSGFWIEAGTGENVLLGVAGALLATAVALDPNARPRRLGMVVVLALLCRQDNVLLVPAWAYALGQRLDGPTRLRTLSVWLAATGAAALAVFTLIWIAFGEDWTFVDYLTYSASQIAPYESGSWSHAGGVDAVKVNVGALTVLVIGLVTLDPVVNICLGLAFVGLLAAMGMLLRGARPARPLVTCALLVVIVRAPFYVWFEPANFEWWLVPVAVIAWTAAALTAGPGPLPRPRLLAASAVSLAMLTGTLWTHAPHSWTLRQQHMAQLMNDAVEKGEAGGRPIWLPLSELARTGFRVRGLRPDRSAMGLSLEGAVKVIKEMTEDKPGQTIVAVHDRSLLYEMPVSETKEEPGPPILDGLGAQYLRRRGRIQAVIIPAKR